ncbi:hypothetical protein AMAG_04464 [Allomyces macrogynus ATCC 38327]|uniref:Aldehyde dehydrogenase domain-containing protein n=1 Tax=Allomyces macrogynus (strain ATCC 38327) TaxID=578462 RepID=A0A0L0S941_ALLM3|nr:hypothetical protein AMAG_04464 [Allomyces macrogynus ATCC 38327]|eukprot:KNE58930.1 hypothetical protein AMAG_04464 [Allomyces macrogynus ATCC 38327]
MASTTTTTNGTAPHRLANFINGAFVPPVAGQYLASPNPSTGAHALDIPHSTAADVDAAVAAAKAAFPIWSKTPRAERSRLLLRVADFLRDNADRFAQAESADQGKPVKIAATLDIPRAEQNLRFFATAALHSMGGHTSELDGPVQAFSYVRREPVGVAALISPWNLPLYLLTWKIAPCLMTGNTCVCKPSEFTSHTAYLLCELFNQAGVPPGVINMVFGDGLNAGQPLVQHKDVPLVSFTGGTVTGARIASIAAPMFKKLSLELGGKNAAIICADANLDQAVATCVRSAFYNQGEICLCTSRILVAREVYDEFMRKYAAAVKQLRVGPPTDPESDLGALVSEQHMKKVLSYVQVAKDEGGAVVTGGHRVHVPGHEHGFYVAPTIVTGLGPQARCMQEEIFGPVTCVSPFDDEKEAIEWCNNTVYGLAASLWTENVSRAHKLAAQIHAGTVWVNCWMVRDLTMPFGGSKQSGVGREGWPSSLEFFTEEKVVCVKL